MAQTLTVNIETTALWPQGDVRDPLGIWGFRLGVTGDGGGGTIKVTAQAQAAVNAAYIYTCYSLTAVQLTGALSASQFVKARLLTSWPNVDPLAGVQAYSSFSIARIIGSTSLTPPEHGPDVLLTKPNDRFLLLFDPRPTAGNLSIVEIEWNENPGTTTFSFEGYGYYWDRSVLNAPGGPRHPGAS